MLSPLRTAEVMLFELLNSLPYLALTVYAFHNCLRFSENLTKIMVCALSAVQVILALLSAALPMPAAPFLSMCSTLFYLSFCFALIRTRLGKAVFTILTVTNIANLLTLLAKCIEGFLFPSFAVQRYRFTFSLVFAVLEALVLPLFFYYVKKYYAAAVTESTDSSAWNLLWLTPATFYAVWFNSFYSTELTATEYALQPRNVLFLLAVSAGSFVAYHAVVQAILDQQEKIRLQRENHELNLQQLQYEALQLRISEMRQVRHDVRHHFTVMSGYVEQGDLAGLKKYFEQYGHSIQEFGGKVYCKNPPLNLLLFYFSYLAQKQGIAFHATANVPAALPAADSDLSVLLGNLLENALEACEQQKPPKPEISVRISLEGDGGALVLLVDNTARTAPRKDRNGAYLSTKHEGNGLGLESVEKITAHYHGVFRTALSEGIFHAQVLLNFDSEG